MRKTDVGRPLAVNTAAARAESAAGGGASADPQRRYPCSHRQTTLVFVADGGGLYTAAFRPVRRPTPAPSVRHLHRVLDTTAALSQSMDGRTRREPAHRYPF